MDSLVRKLQIGFMDSIPLEERCRLIASDLSVAETIKRYPGETNHYQDAIETVEWLEKGKGNIIWYGNPNFPDFRPIERKLPYFLLYKGTFMDIRQTAVSIVGTRHVDNEGYQMAFKLGLEAASNNIAVVSGLADGCDQASLYGATAMGFKSYGILGCGLEVDYPKFTKELKNKMIECGGAIISRFSPNCPPLRYNFPNRNLTIAAMGYNLIVIQAPKKSGSLITADMALQMGKDVFVSKAGIGNFWARVGTNSLVDDGAIAISKIPDIFDVCMVANESNDQKGIRFGNKHYCLRSLN